MKAKIKQMYETMVKIRTFEETIADILENRPGEIKTPCHLYIGEEAVATGVCAALRDTDTVYSTHRSHGHYIAKGGDLKALAAEIYCKKTGCSHGRGGSMHICDPDKGLPGSCAIVAGTIPVAVGTALAYKYRKEDNVAVSFFGDGATSEGVFYESLNLAALYHLPILFVCENNQYSTHLHITKILAEPDIRTKSETMGVPAQIVDGNDVNLVYTTTRTLINNARKGNGPALLECITYRWRGHVGPKYDLDKGLRSKEELEYWMKRDPIKITEKKEGLTEEYITATRLRTEEEVQKAIEYAQGD